MAVLRLGYTELAERLGRTTDAARTLVRRKRWQVTKGNDGRSVILVEETELPNGRSGERPPGRPPEQPEHRPNDALLARALKAEAEATAQQTVIAELRATVAWHRLPWWKRMIS